MPLVLPVTRADKPCSAEVAMESPLEASPPEGRRTRPSHGARGRRISLEDDEPKRGFGTISDESFDKNSRRMRIQLGMEQEAEPADGGHAVDEEVEDLLDEAVFTPKLPVEEKVYKNPVGLLFNG